MPDFESDPIDTRNHLQRKLIGSIALLVTFHPSHQRLDIENGTAFGAIRNMVQLLVGLLSIGTPLLLHRSRRVVFREEAEMYAFRRLVEFHGVHD